LRDLKVVSDRIELTKYGGELVRVNRAATEDAQAPKRLKVWVGMAQQFIVHTWLYSPALC
jgi:hypothetical protein